MAESSLLSQFIEICGAENVSDNELDLIAYSSDLASLPQVLKQMYKIQNPKYVLRPSSTEQVAAIIKIARQSNLPFTARAGASSGTGAVIPVDDGLVIDMTRMQTLLDIDQTSQQVTIQPGITWQKLNFRLKKVGFMVGIHPSSSPSATVGGFISTGGYAGIGAPKYGPISKQVQKLRVVLPSGIIREIIPPLTSLFVGAEGTLGIVTEITVQIYPKSQSISPLAFGFSDLDSVIGALEALIKSGITPYHVMLFDRKFFDVTKSLGLDGPSNEIVLLLTIEGFELTAQDSLDIIHKIFPPKSQLEKKFALEEWERRFKAELFIKRAGPSLILLELGIPLRLVPQLYKNFHLLGKSERIELGFCGILGHGNTMLCMPFILTDEQKPMDYFKILLFSRKLTSAAIKLGGAPYGIGLWGSSYLPFVHTQDKLKIFSAIKQVFDEKNLCNPGKITEDRTPEQMRPPKP